MLGAMYNSLQKSHYSEGNLNILEHMKFKFKVSGTSDYFMKSYARCRLSD